MFCDGCGATVDSAQPFCGQCGKQLRMVASAAPARGRVQGNLQLLGILWLVFSGMHILTTVVGLAIGAAFLGQLALPFHTSLLAPLAGAIGLLFVTKSALGLVAGWGLLQRAPWARLLAIVLAFISLVHVPFGTALGVYTLVILLPVDAEKEYETLSARG